MTFPSLSWDVKPCVIEELMSRTVPVVTIVPDHWMMRPLISGEDFKPLEICISLCFVDETIVVGFLFLLVTLFLSVFIFCLNCFDWLIWLGYLSDWLGLKAVVALGNINGELLEPHS